MIGAFHPCSAAPSLCSSLPPSSPLVPCFPPAPLLLSPCTCPRFFCVRAASSRALSLPPPCIPAPPSELPHSFPTWQLLTPPLSLPSHPNQSCCATDDSIGGGREEGRGGVRSLAPPAAPSPSGLVKLPSRCQAEERSQAAPAGGGGMPCCHSDCALSRLCCTDLRCL